MVGLRTRECVSSFVFAFTQELFRYTNSFDAFRNNTMRREQFFERHSGSRGDQTSVEGILNARLTHLSCQIDDNWKRCMKSSLRVSVILHFK